MLGPAATASSAEGDEVRLDTFAGSFRQKRTEDYRSGTPRRKSSSPLSQRSRHTSCAVAAQANGRHTECACYFSSAALSTRRPGHPAASLGGVIEPCPQRFRLGWIEQRFQLVHFSPEPAKAPQDVLPIIEQD